MSVVVTVPPGVVTVMGPEETPLEAVAVTKLSDFTVKPAAAPLNLTEVAFVRFTPWMSTDVRGPPMLGEKLVMRGAKRKLVSDMAKPAGAETRIGPLTAPGGMMAVILVLDLTLNAADRLRKLTSKVP